MRQRVRVGIDATPMLVRQRTGIERYATALVRELAILAPTIDDIQLVVYLHAGNPYCSKEHVEEATEILIDSGVQHRTYSQRRGYGIMLSAYAILDQVALIHMLSRARPQLRVCPYVLTLYDVKAVGLSEEGQRIERAVLSKREKRIVQQAHGLITISDSTAKDLESLFGGAFAIPISTIELGVDVAYFSGKEQVQTIRRKYSLSKYILFVGTLQYRKNLPRLIEAFASLKHNKRIPHKLVLAGRDGWGAELVYQAVKDHHMEAEVVFPGYIPESDLPGLYAAADLFAYPSLHEGFGIPLLEAMASGTVICTSHLFSIPEVAGDAVVYVNPYDVASIVAGLDRALHDEVLRTSLTAKGKARAAAFSWQHMAMKTLDFYRHLIDL